MLKALFNKEVLRVLSSMNTKNAKSKNKKKKQVDGKGGIVLFIAVWGFVLFALAMAFLGISTAFADALVPIGMEWLFYAIMGLIAMVLSIVGNSLTASTVIFKAKDNELLLSMPIPPAYILATRTMLIFVMSVLFAAVPLLPSFITHAGSYGGVGVKGFICCFVLIICIALIVTAVSALLGWLLALISKHIKNKSLVTTAFIVIFLAAYYYVYFNVNKYIQALVASSLEIGSVIEGNFFARPILLFGLGASGDIKSLLLFVVLIIVIFCIVYFILTRNLSKILTMSEAAVTKEFDEDEERQQANVQQNSVKKALLKKEFGRFLASPTYMVNCGLGLIIMAAGCVFVAIKFGYLRSVSASLAYLASGGVGPVPELLGQLSGKVGDFFSMISEADLSMIVRINNALPIVVMFVLWALLSTCGTATPAVAIEGKNMWILKMLPVDSKEVLFAKRNMQVVLCTPLTIVLGALLCFALGFELSTGIFVVVCSILFIMVHASVGLLLGLINPNLEWSSEATPIKQNLWVLVTFFGGPLIALGIGVLYFFVLYQWVSGQNFLLGVLVALAVATRVLDNYIRTKGVAMYEAL